MKKGFKYFLFFLVGLIVFGLIVSVLALNLPISEPSDEPDDTPNVDTQPEGVYYPVSTVLENIRLTSYDSLSVSEGDRATMLNFTAQEGYTYPSDITVVGCEYIWNPFSGQLALFRATRDVTVTITAVEDTSTDNGDTEEPVAPTYYTITQTLSKTNASSSNPTQISNKDNFIELKFTAYDGYSLPTSVTVTGCTYVWNYLTGLLTLSNPTGNVSIKITSIEDVYNITQSLTYVIADASNPPQIPASLGSYNVLYYYTAADGYELPDSVTVTGADYSWSKTLGRLTLKNVTDNVQIVINGVKKAVDTQPEGVYNGTTWKLRTDLYIEDFEAAYAVGPDDKEVEISFVTSTALTSRDNEPCSEFVSIYYGRYEFYEIMAFNEERHSYFLMGSGDIGDLVTVKADTITLTAEPSEEALAFLEAFATLCDD